MTDPPYGIKDKRNYSSRGRGLLTKSNDYKSIVGDFTPFDPAHLLVYRKIAIFGANNFCDKLPISQAWWYWDKLAGLESKREIGFNDNADGELIWTNFKGPVRIIRHRWMGMLKDSERTEKRKHPTQKPVAIAEVLIETQTNEGDTVLDPYMGVGWTALACKKLNRKFIGIEIEKEYLGITIERLNALIV